MRIFICTMEDPVYTLPFIRAVIDARREEVVGLAVSRRNRLTVGRNRSRGTYALSLLLIMGVRSFVRSACVTVLYRLRKLLSDLTGIVRSDSILAYAADRGIPTFEVSSVNCPELIQSLEELKPDVIINQAQDILQSAFLRIPTIGVLNRHNSLLPRNRGRLTPFWVVYRREKETGVSIHFVTEEIDAGDIVVQKRFEITDDDDFNSVVARSYACAAEAMLEALDVLETGKPLFGSNNGVAASYNSVPTFQEALDYRKQRIKKWLGGR